MGKLKSKQRTTPVNGKARASQPVVAKSTISSAEKSRVMAKANRILAGKGG